MLEWRRIWNKSIETSQEAVLKNDQKGKVFERLREWTDIDGTQPYKNDKMVDFEEGISYECLKQYEKAIKLYEIVSSEEYGLPVEHWRKRANIFLQRTLRKKAGCPRPDDIGEDCKPETQWNAFYYLHSFVYIPHHIRYLAISSMSRVDSEPEMSIVIFRTCLEEIIRILHPIEYENHDKKKQSFGPLVQELCNTKFLLTKNDSLKLQEEKNWCEKIIERGNAAAHGNNHGQPVDYNPEYRETTIIYFIRIMQRANEVLKIMKK